jgi:hypothetical protein
VGVAKIIGKRMSRRAQLVAQERPLSTRSSSMLYDADAATEEAMSARGTLVRYSGSPVPDLRPSSRLSGDAGGVEAVGRNSAGL